MIVFDSITPDDAITPAGQCVGIIENPGKAEKTRNKWKKKTIKQKSKFRTTYITIFTIYNTMKWESANSAAKSTGYLMSVSGSHPIGGGEDFGGMIKGGFF